MIDIHVFKFYSFEIHSPLYSIFNHHDDTNSLSILLIVPTGKVSGTGLLHQSNRGYGSRNGKSKKEIDE